MASTERARSSSKSSQFLCNYGWDLLLGSISALYVIMMPYTKVEESFNVQGMHDILYHNHHIVKYDHLEFPGVVSRTFIGALIISILASPVVLVMHFLQLPKICSLITVRLVLGCIVLSTLRLFRIQIGGACAIRKTACGAMAIIQYQAGASSHSYIGVLVFVLIGTLLIRRKFGGHVEAFFAVLTALQFHLLFYSTRPLPNILSLALVNLAYCFWFKGNSSATMKCLTFATIVFRCDMVLLFGPIGIELLLSKSVSIWEAIKCCISTALLCIGFTLLIDTIMWQKIVWPELEVFWFNSILNRSSEWGTHSFHWYFTSALPRSLLAAYPLCLLGVLLDKRIRQYILPVFSFVLLYSKLPHKELRFIIASIPVFNVSAAIAASRIYNNRKKKIWRWLYVIMLGSFLVSLGCTIITAMASYYNYPGAYALKALHQKGSTNTVKEKWVHIDPFTAMNGVSRFSENNCAWRYSKEEGISLAEYRDRNFTYLLNEHHSVDGFKCLFAVNGFSKARFKIGFPPVMLVKEPKVFIQGSLREEDNILSNWTGCSFS